MAQLVFNIAGHGAYLGNLYRTVTFRFVSLQSGQTL
jgi:hypothetical protein